MSTYPARVITTEDGYLVTCYWCRHHRIRSTPCAAAKAAGEHMSHHRCGVCGQLTHDRQRSECGDHCARCRGGCSVCWAEREARWAS